MSVALLLTPLLIRHSSPAASLRSLCSVLAISPIIMLLSFPHFSFLKNKKQSHVPLVAPLATTTTTTTFIVLPSSWHRLRDALSQQQQQQQQQQQLMSLSLLLQLQLVAPYAVMRVYDCEDDHYLFIPIHVRSVTTDASTDPSFIPDRLTKVDMLRTRHIITIEGSSSPLLLTFGIGSDVSFWHVPRDRYY